MDAATYLIKVAIADKMKFVMERPFSDNMPQQRNSYESRQVAQELYGKLQPQYKRVVDARLRGRSLMST